MFQWLTQLFSGPAPARAPAPVAPAPVAAAAAPVQASAPARPAPSAPASNVSFEQKDDVNANYYSWLFDTPDESDLNTNEVETDVLETLEKIIASEQSGAALVRRLPGLIPQLLQSLRSSDFSGAQLSRTISNDVVLVAALIRLANSSFQGTGKTITSIEHAVIVIGQEGLRQLITSIAFRPIIDLNSGAITRSLAPRIWAQSERCAVANRRLAEEMGIAPFDAFLAGLVQYVGLMVSLRIMDQSAKNGQTVGSTMFCSRLLRNARKLSCSIGEEWDFPPAVTLAISEQGTVRKGVPISPLGRLLSLSDYLSKVRALVEADRLTEGDARLFHGLSASALACYHQFSVDDTPATELPDAAAVRP